MMKTMLLMCVLGLAAAKGLQTVKCTASGDPHYQPFGTKGKAAKWTVMGEGEYALAKSTATDDDFLVSSCSQDVSTGRKSTKKLTWNRDFSVTGDGHTVRVDGGGDAQDYKVYLDGDMVADLGVHSVDTNWLCDATAKGKVCREIDSGSVSGIQIILRRKKQKHSRGNQIVIKLKKSSRVIMANIYSKEDSGKYGKRTLFNIVIKVPKKEQEKYSGFCTETKADMKAKDLTDAAVISSFKTTEIASCNHNDATFTEEDTDLLVNELIDPDAVAPCEAEVTKDAIQKCSVVNSEDMLGCVLDALNDCDAGDIQDLIDFEQDSVDYTCPTNSYISSMTWPITTFGDCECNWGHSRDDDEETCTAPAVVTPPTPIFGACFCDGTSPYHCMHTATGDGSCGLPTVTTSLTGEACTNPLEALGTNPLTGLPSDECSCAPGTIDCTGTSYTLEVVTQPAMAVPGSPFNQQPKVRLVDHNGNIVKDSKTKIRISVANAQSDTCKCEGATPCMHDNVADNTCFAKNSLFGEMVCPAGTTECLATQTTTKLFQTIVGEDANDADSLEARTTQCRTSTGMQSAAGNTFCSGMTPCKHQNDGHCMQKTAFYAQKIEAAPVDIETCKGKQPYRTAVPSKVNGWFFETDVSCSMDPTAIGCTTSGHSYAMDKWCDHNCHPKYPNQPPYCPASHCDCTTVAAPTVTPDTSDWRCPADRYNDGTCRCTPGTEFCGAIETTLVGGYGQFSHLALGNTGKYQLLIEVIMPDQNAGTNNVRVTTKTTTFEVQYAKEKGTVCRAQAQWRKDAMYDSEAHGEGKAWHYEDSKSCTSYAADGKCDAVATEKEYAMDKWCVANKCADHALVSHCEWYSPVTEGAEEACISGAYDMFGDCCESEHVDACGVCNGDGSTCKVTAYIAEPVELTGQTAIIFNVSLADDSCDMKTPCMHLNDFTCGPKTVNSAVLVGDEHHCYWDRRATAEEQTNWKFGTWDIEGRMSKSIETQIEDGNTDCFCPAGTVDISKKLEIEDKAKEDFVQGIKDKIDIIIDGDSSGITPPEVVIWENSNSAYMYDAAGCTEGARKAPLSSIYNNVLCGTHWDLADGSPSGNGNCNRASAHPTCTNDVVRSIMLPPMTTAKLYKHCNNNFDSPSNTRYPTIENYGLTAKCYDLDAGTYDTSNIVIEGAVLKVVANVVGTPADCMETKCMQYVQACRDDAVCAKVLELAEEIATQGEDFINGLREFSEDPNVNFKNLFTCAGQASTACDPTVGTIVSCHSGGVSTINVPTFSNASAVILPADFTIMPTTTLGSSAFTSGSSFFERRRLVIGSTGTAVVQVSSGGNQGVVGAASSTGAASGQFATGASSSGASGVTTSAGTGTAGAIGIAIGCTAIAALAVAFVVHQKQGAQPISNQATSVEMTRGAEDHTDVL